MGLHDAPIFDGAPLWHRSIALFALSARSARSRPFTAVKRLWRPREARALRVVRRLGEVCRGCNLPPTVLGPRGVDQKFAIVAKFPE